MTDKEKVLIFLRDHNAKHPESQILLIFQQWPFTNVPGDFTGI